MGAEIAGRALRLLAVLAPALLAGCSSLKSIREASLLDRCADLMQQAFPGGNIRITKKEQLTEAPTQSVATVVVAVEGVRRKLPENSPLLRNLAVECRFNEGILTSFRWTAGPLRAAQ
jgi:hypothetical protein